MTPDDAPLRPVTQEGPEPWVEVQELTPTGVEFETASEDRDIMKRWQHPIYGPERFVRECFKVEPDKWQLKALRLFNTSPKLAMKASKGVGKSAVLSWLIWYFMVTRYDPKVAVVSISWDNLSDCLWAELAHWRGQCKFLEESFEWTKKRIYNRRRADKWWGSARSFSKDADPQKQSMALAGLHKGSILFVIDEAGSVPDSVAITAEAVLAEGGDSHLVISGNPTMLSGPLYRAFRKETASWGRVEVSGDPDDPDRSPRVDIDWARQMIKDHGRDNPWVIVNVFGQFPPASMNALLGPEDIRRAQARQPRPDQYESHQKRIGVDVARFGDDSTVIIRRQGCASYDPYEMRHKKTPVIASRVHFEAKEFGGELIAVDGTGGWGAGVVDHLELLGREALEVNFSGKADDPKFFNKRTEMWFRMAEWIKKSGAISKDVQLAKELEAPEYFFQQDKLRLEEKDQIKSRLGFSPDKADSLALTFCTAEEMTSDPYKTQDTPMWLMQRVQPPPPRDYDPAWDDRSQNP